MPANSTRHCKDGYQRYNHKDDADADIEDDRVQGIQHCIAAAKQGPQAVKLANLVRIGSNDYYGIHEGLYGSTNYMLSIRQQDPSDDQDWTKAKLNASEFGQRVQIGTTTSTTTTTTT